MTSEWSADAQQAQRLHSECTTRAQRLTHEKPMNLVPVRPPGPNARKARAFAADILRLRSQGYTFEAIREALAGAGVHVSNSTVQREAARAARQPPVITSMATAPPDANPAAKRAGSEATVQDRVREALSPPAPPAAQGTSAPSTFANGPSGKDVAEAFMSTQITNPVVRAKEQR
jgi:hypothetical protein